MAAPLPFGSPPLRSTPQTSPPVRWAVRAFVVLVPLLSLLLLGRLVADWVEVTRITGEAPRAAAERGFDWVQWEDRDGEIVAAYVYPGGTAYAAGLREGAVLYRLDFQQFFLAEDVKRAVEGVPPGTALSYEVVEPAARGGGAAAFEIPISRYPTFLYPLGGTLWQAALWGFALATFLHVLGLVIVAPLAERTRRTRRTFWLFAAAALWVGGNLLRLLAITLLGPPLGGAYATAFAGLTVVALGGWILFPALLLHAVVCDLPALRRAAGSWTAAVFLPPAVLGAALLAAALAGGVGPLTLDSLIAPVLFYVCCTVAAATGLTLAAGFVETDADADEPGVPAAAAWSRAGSAGVFLLSTVAALSVAGAVPLPGAVSDATVGWLILLVQLLSLAPVGLVSIATLRHGAGGAVATDALAYLGGLGTVFFFVVAGLLVLDAAAGIGTGWGHALAAGAYVVLVLVAAERVVRWLRQSAARWLPTERQRKRARLRALGERMPGLLDAQQLADEAVAAVTDALGARSAVLLLRDPAYAAGEAPRWIRAASTSEPPFSEADLAGAWAELARTGAVWARNPELDESALPPGEERRLAEVGAALAVPVTGGEAEGAAPAGLLVLGRKARRRAVYNVEDVALLRGLAVQLALAVERLALVEREKALVRETATAQLTALRAQINPHFLFNTLNTIAALIAERPADAERGVERLSAIFRHILRTEGRPFVPLRDEARLVDHYLAIEALRFGEKLTVERDWDPALMDLPVPAFALQTLVENAVKHGIERKRTGGRILLSSRAETTADGAVAVLRVADTGAGLVPSPLGDGLPSPEGFYGTGLRNVADRLDRLFGERGGLRLHGTPGAGTTAEIVIPLEQNPAAP